MSSSSTLKDGIMKCERCKHTIHRGQRYVITQTLGVWDHRTHHRDEIDCHQFMLHSNVPPEIKLTLRPGPPEAA